MLFLKDDNVIIVEKDYRVLMAITFGYTDNYGAYNVAITYLNDDAKRVNLGENIFLEVYNFFKENSNVYHKRKFFKELSNKLEELPVVDSYKEKFFFVTPDSELKNIYY